MQKPATFVSASLLPSDWLAANRFLCFAGDFHDKTSPRCGAAPSPRRLNLPSSRVGDSRLGGIAEMCYYQLEAKCFGAYDSATLQQFLCRRLSSWHTQFPVTGPAVGASDSDSEEGGGAGAKAGANGSGSEDAPPILDE